MAKINKLIFLVLSVVVFNTVSYAQSTSFKAPIIEDGETQIIKEFTNPKNWIREDLWVETEFDSDGDGKMDRMHVDVTRPIQTNNGLKLAIIYGSSPYYDGTAKFVKGLFWDVNHEIGAEAPPRVHPEVDCKCSRPTMSNQFVNQWVPRGFIVVHSSSPGTGLSDGSPTVGGENESLAPKAVIEWLTGKANGYKERTGNEKVMAFWSTGKIGMTGTSYEGTLPVAAATTGVKGLEAIIPVAPNTSYYHYYRSNGLVRSPGGFLGEDVDVLYDFIHSGDPAKRARNNKVVRDTEMANGMDRKTGDYNDFWAKRDYLNQVKPWRAALLMSHGFNDWNVMPEHSYRIYNAVRAKGVPSQIYYHQNGHGGPPPFKMMNRWFTRFLYGVQNGVEKEPKAWIVREGAKRDSPTPYADYPNPAAKDISFYLKAGAPKAGELVNAKPEKQGVETVIDDASISGKEHATSESSENRLLFMSPVLKAPVHISGTAKIKIRVSSDKPAVNLSAWLVALPLVESKLTTDKIITRGWADPQNHKSMTESKPLEPGKFYDLSFEFQPDDQIIPAGKRIALVIFSSDKEFTLHPPPGTKLMVDLDHTELSLPIVSIGQSTF